MILWPGDLDYWEQKQEYEGRQLEEARRRANNREGEGQVVTPGARPSAVATARSTRSAPA